MSPGKPSLSDSCAAVIVKTIDERAKSFDRVQNELWKNPELKFEETSAHNLLVSELQKEGFSVTPNYVLPTAFKAEFGNGKVDSPVVCFICEYDALPEIGHACGHNLIAETGLAATVALKKAYESDPTLPGKVVVIGTPGEEGGCGKVLLIDGGAFKGIDVVIMVHPSNVNDMAPPFLAIGKVRARYRGKASHAAGYPWEGVNALDAAVTCYSNISVLRQQIKPTWKIHGVITNGGTTANVIPDVAEMYYYYRAPNGKDLELLRRKLEACFNGAAIATGCAVDLEWHGGYDSLLTNKVLAEVFKKHAESLGISFQDVKKSKTVFMASSDIGSVSHLIPTIHPTYDINTTAPNHSKEFTEAAGSSAAQESTLIMAKAMALTGLEILRDSQLLEKVHTQFQTDTSESS